MFRTTLAMFTAAALCGLAHAQEGRVVTASLNFDSAQLSTEAGAEAVLYSLKRQAKRACRTLSMVSAGFTYDEQCAETMVADAVEKIGSDTLAQTYAALETAAADS